MTLKMNEGIEVYSAIKGILEGDVTGSLGLKLVLIQKKLEAEIKLFEEERVKLVTKYGEPSKKDPNATMIPKEKIADFTKELNDMLSVEVDLAIAKLKASDVDNIASTKGANIMGLLPIIDLED